VPCWWTSVATTSAAAALSGAILVARNSLEWRCDPASEWRHPAITSRDLHIILICQQGYQSSLAAATLQQLGLIHATDLDGGFTAWAAAGLPVITLLQAAATAHPVTVTSTDHADLATDTRNNE